MQVCQVRHVRVLHRALGVLVKLRRVIEMSLRVSSATQPENWITSRQAEGSECRG